MSFKIMWGHIITIDNAGLGRRPRNPDSKWSMGYNPNMREDEPAYENATSLYSPEPEEIHASTSLSLKPSASRLQWFHCHGLNFHLFNVCEKIKLKINYKELSRD
jgi:hypothetical protein